MSFGERSKFRETIRNTEHEDMSKRIHLIGIIAVIIYFLSVGSFLISQTDIALTIWELMTVISGPIVLLVLLEF